MASGHKEDKNGRSGRYIQQPNHYRAFVPAPLPPDPPVELTHDLQLLLSKGDQALGRLDGSILTLPNSDLFVFMYVRKEAVLSSQIEGTQSSLQDVLVAEAQILAPDRPQDVGDVVNYVRAMNYGLERLKSLPVSVRLLTEIHEQLLQGVRGSHLTPGELRRSQNWIGPAGCTLSEATFVPPPPHEVSQHLGALEKFLHDEIHLPLLIKIGLAHAQFETIHPFLDGNGRVGRLLISFLLCEQKVLLKPALYLSHYFKKHRTEYYERLQAVRDDSDWEAWLKFFLTGVVEVSGQATETVRAILRLREDHRKAVTEHFGRTAGNGHKILEHLYQHPILSVNQAQELIHTTYPAANDLVTRMVDLEILQEVTGQLRNRRFMYSSYVRLFREED